MAKETALVRKGAFESNMEFWGYGRTNGTVGTRNYVGIISTVVCANEVAVRIAAGVEGAVAFTHSQGCGLIAHDLLRVEQTLGNLGQNPNLGALLLVSLGCESTNIQSVLKKIQAAGKPVELVTIQKEGGLTRAVATGIHIAQKLYAKISTLERQPFDLKKLRIGIKCGASDTTSGIVTNPLIGYVANLLVEIGCTVVIGETPEFLGAEHIIASRIKEDNVRLKFLSTIQRTEDQVIATGFDLRGTQPSRGNIAGGLTTIEEKSLGSISKAGTSPIKEVIPYGNKPSTNGLVMVDSPAREPELLTALAAAGAQIIVFTTGRGAPQGFPFVPVIKVTGNQMVAETMKEHIDLCLDIREKNDPELVVNKILDLVVSIAGGQLTQAEALGYHTGDIAVKGPIM